MKGQAFPGQSSQTGLRLETTQEGFFLWLCQGVAALGNSHIVLMMHCRQRQGSRGAPGLGHFFLGDNAV